MRFKITLAVLNSDAIVSLNYTHLISDWLGGIIQKANQKYKHFAQERGYRVPDCGSPFQFFTFSNLIIPQKDILGDRMRIRSREISFIVSFYMPNGLEELIMDSFQKERIQWMSRRSQAQFRVQEINYLPDHIHTEKVLLKTLSPMIISQQDESGKLHYLNPENPNFEECFWDDLISKYANCLGYYTHEILDFVQPFQPSFQLINTYPASYQYGTLKDGSQELTSPLGYTHFEFELDAPQELIRLGLWGGFGRYNNRGFGCCALLDS